MQQCYVLLCDGCHGSGWHVSTTMVYAGSVSYYAQWGVQKVNRPETCIIFSFEIHHRREGERERKGT